MGCNYFSVLADKAFNYIGNDQIFLKRMIPKIFLRKNREVS